ncbi:hypothetical protein L2K70_07165 [Nocardioides KLBMP 9356]|uniref:Uncharacterized protein n=1 Tax=Nocardioides potassii TaxID=2911371 RepID=A0ABS9HA55_9ACTN|nr:hypothetical protein [Nocardioides potassii]MCF6377379.1 hypothetical protein [Nocardioides potassii]
MRRTDANDRTTPEANATARELIASFGHDPETYVPGTVTVLPGTRTATYDLACSPDCPHPDGRCHRPHAAYLSDDAVRARLVPAQRREA